MSDQDSQIRRYIEGRLDDDASAHFERSTIRDRVIQVRMDELRLSAAGIKQLFTFEPYDLSHIAVNVRARNPHRALGIPPAASLWIQLVAMSLLLIYMRLVVGVYIPPPQVRLAAVEGVVTIDGREGAAETGTRILPNQEVTTAAGAQATLVLEESNRIKIAPESTIVLRDPRSRIRQVIELKRGEAWGRIATSGEEFALVFDGGAWELRGSEAEFDLVVGDRAPDLLPSNFVWERLRNLVDSLDEPANAAGLVVATEPIEIAGFELVGADGPGRFRLGDRIIEADGLPIRDRRQLKTRLRHMRAEEGVELRIVRDGRLLTWQLKPTELAPTGVLRVFRGAVHAHPRSGTPLAILRGQWMVFYESQPPTLGRKGFEDFRLLRIDASDRFKNLAHWLNTASYPLRAENNVIELERRLSALAERLMRMQESEVLREGVREIELFEKQLKAELSAARERIEDGNPTPPEDLPETGPLRYSDAQLTAAQETILGEIAHWRTRSSTGAYSTLGSAAKTLHSRIESDRQDMEIRDQELARALVMMQRIETLASAIAEQGSAIDGLKRRVEFDLDGSRRAALDVRIGRQRDIVRAATPARSRAELITLALNELDIRIDALARRLPELTKALADAKTDLTNIDAAIAANPFTPARMAEAERAAETAQENLKQARDGMPVLHDAVDAALKRRNDASDKVAEARKPINALDKAANDAAALLAGANAARDADEATVEEASATVSVLQERLDGLKEDDPERVNIELELAAARQTLTTAQASFSLSKISAEEAERAEKAAASELQDAKAALAAAKTELENSRTALTDRKRERESERTKVATLELEFSAARKAVDDFAKAESDLKQLRTRRAEAIPTRDQAQTALAECNTDLASLQAEADPKRADLAKQQGILDEADTAQWRINELALQRDAMQAVTDEIQMRQGAVAELDTEREGLASSRLVKGYDLLQEDYNALSSRVAAFEYLRARALLEDESFALEQKAALQRYDEAARDAESEAVRQLERFCGGYAGQSEPLFQAPAKRRRLADAAAEVVKSLEAEMDTLRPGAAEGDEEKAKQLEALEARLDDAVAEAAKLSETVELQEKLLRALWQLYYYSGRDQNAPDGFSLGCYYVIVTSGAGKQALRNLDERWRAGVAAVLGKELFEKATELEPKDLTPPTGGE